MSSGEGLAVIAGAAPLGDLMQQGECDNAEWFSHLTLLVLVQI